MKLERVPDVRLAGTARRPFVAVAFGDGVAAIGDHGAFRVFDREGKLQFDAASLPKPTKKSDAELAKEMGDAIMARGMAEHDAAQAAADLAADNDARARRAKGVKALLIAGAVAALAVLALSVLMRV